MIPVIYGWCFWDVKDAVQRAGAQTALGCQKWHSSALLRNSPSCAGAHRLRQSSQSASRTASSVPLFPGRLACKSLLPAVPLLRPPKQHFVEHQRVTRALYKVNTSSYTQTHSFTGDPEHTLTGETMPKHILLHLTRESPGPSGKVFVWWRQSVYNG